MTRTAFLGGTGPEGLGLAIRFALAGDEIIIGSRQAERAEQAAEKIRQRLGTKPTPPIRGMENHAAVRDAEVIVVTLPFGGIEALMTDLAPDLEGKLLLDVVNPLKLSRGIFRSIPVTAGSAAELIQQLLPKSRVVSGFKNQSATELWDIEHPMHGDVLICSDLADAKAYAEQLVARIPQLRAIDAGPLLNARHLESITTLLLNLNRRYKTETSIQILGV